ncbi:MAG: PD40 domain-containing protein [Deltaproteobacteria bacterium]|nr:PD40 domain-containing protein [Deltaproteobacteria bacterium]
MRRITPLLVFFALALSLGVRPAAEAAAHDPALRWRTIVTDHFRIHYAEGLERDASELARIAEEVHGPLVDTVGWEPAEPTEITLVDETDLANGYTTILPYNRMVLYPVRPGLFQTIGDYSGWLRTLFVHEYAHVLGLDPVRGYSKVMRRIFGRTFAPATPVGALAWFVATPPNVFLPPWFHEGLAVNLESDLTGRGRRASTLYDMIYRVDVAEGTVPPLDRLGGDFPVWPSFSTRYIYGTRLLAAAREASGPDTLRRLVLGHSSRFPYTINSPPRAVTGVTYQGLYDRMRAGLETEFEPQIRRLRAEGLTAAAELPATAHSETGPLWLDDRTIVCTRDDQVHTPVLVRKDAATGREEELAERPGGRLRATRLSDGRVAYTRVEVSKPLAGGLLASDLYALRPGGLWPERLTRSARVLEADWSPAEGSFAAVQVDASSQRLVRLAFEGREPQATPLLAESGVRYDGPRWSPDGKWVAFSRKTDAGQARLALLEVATGAVRLLTPEGTQAGFPAWSPDGTRLAFAWDRTGVWDLYEWEAPTGSIRRLTRLLGGGFEPDWSPDGRRLAFTTYSGKGFGVAVLERAAALNDPVIDVPALETLAPTLETPAAPPVASSRYAPYPRALPTFWLPDLISDHAGGAAGVWTAGTDPLDEHLYYLSAFWGWNSRRPYGVGTYRYDAWYPTLTVNAWKLPVLHTDLLKAPGATYDYWEENRTVSLEARLALPRALRTTSLAVAYAWEEVGRLSRIREDLDGRRDLADLPFEGKQNPLSVSLLYDSAFPHDNRFTLGAEAGTRLEAIYRLRRRALGADLDLEDVVGEWRHYERVPGVHGVVAALRAKAGKGWGDVPLQSVYQLGGEAGEFPVRGYPDRVDRGDRAFAGSAELRFPLWGPYRGLRDWPLFLGRLHGAGFFDAGRTWGSGQGGDGAWRRGAGAELRVDTVLGYYLPTTFVLGYGHGFDEGGEDRGYATFTGVY